MRRSAFPNAPRRLSPRTEHPRPGSEAGSYSTRPWAGAICDGLGHLMSYAPDPAKATQRASRRSDDVERLCQDWK